MTTWESRQVEPWQSVAYCKLCHLERGDCECVHHEDIGEVHSICDVMTCDRCEEQRQGLRVITDVALREYNERRLAEAAVSMFRRKE